MKTTYDIELLTKLEKPLQKGIVKELVDLSLLLAEIEKKYPTGFSGIDWGEVKAKLSVNLSDYDLNQKKEVIDTFFLNIVNKFPDLCSEKVIIIGDGLTNVGFEMHFEYFIQIMHIFFELPQHTYIWFPKCHKCINLTFENELYFG